MEPQTQSERKPGAKGPIPLCVDLDGTLIKTDLLWESLVRLLRHKPLSFFAVPFWWARGRAQLKRELGKRVGLDPSLLPCHEPFREFLKSEKQNGRRLFLATASDERQAAPVAEHFGLFEGVFASDGQVNLRGEAKRDALARAFGERSFDYAGNSSVDIPVWQGARSALVVNASPGLQKRANGVAAVERVFPRSVSSFKAFLLALRPIRWLKNLLLFVPLIASHHLLHWPALEPALLGFVAFCLGASGVYLLNDLFDLDADRRHPRKKHRPFAAGDLSLAVGLFGGPMLVAAAEVVGAFVSRDFAVNLATYGAVAISYSWVPKRSIMLGVLVGTALYTLRLIAGEAATHIPLSSWLVVVFFFLFLSLALVEERTAKV